MYLITYQTDVQFFGNDTEFVFHHIAFSQDLFSSYNFTAKFSFLPSFYRLFVLLSRKVISNGVRLLLGGNSWQVCQFQQEILPILASLAIWGNASKFCVKILSNLLMYPSLKGHSLEFSET